MSVLAFASIKVSLFLVFLFDSTSPECDFETFPNVIALRTLTYHHICGGALLHARWALTAAHCVYTRQRFMTKMIIVTKDRFLNTLITVEINEIFIHDIYDPKTLEFDMSLIMFQEDIIQGTVLTRIAGPRITSQLILTGSKNTSVITWKANLPFSEDRTSLEIYCIYSNLISGEACKSALDEVLHKDTMFCASNDEGKQPCRGDSGSPVFVERLLIGLVSFGASCEKRVNQPNVFTKVAIGIDFINKTVRSRGYVLKSMVLGMYDINIVASKETSFSVNCHLIIFMLSLVFN